MDHLELSPGPDTLLIVDDDKMNREILAGIFAQQYRILTAENGAAGLRTVLKHQNELCAILLDVMVPVMDGIELLRALSRLGLPQRVPVFLITAKASNAVMKEAYQLGVMDVINKPVIPYMVLRRVQSVVELYQARQQLKSKVEAQQADLLAQAEKIIELNQGMIESLSTAIEFRSEESGAHVRRIHDITRYLLATTSFGTGLTDMQIEQIALAAIMHDVGKIAVPDHKRLPCLTIF